MGDIKIIALSLFLTAFAFPARADDARSGQAGTRGSVQSKQKASAPTAAQQDEMVFVIFDSAEKNHASGDFQKAGQDLDRAADKIGSFVSEATEKTRGALAQSAEDLKKIASDLKAGTQVEASRMKDVFSRSEVAIAHYYNDIGLTHLAKKETRRAGQDLRMAAEYFNHSVKWTGQELDKGAKAAIQGARKVSEKLVSGTEKISADVGRAFDDLGRSIEKSGRKLERVASR